MAGKDYYIILGISPSEGAAGIREAFRRLAKKHHPDLGGSEATFQELARAYEVLSDPEQRREYDQSLGRRNASPQAEPLVRPGWSGEHQPEPLVPKPMSVLHGFQTLQPSFDPLFDRMLRNFTGLRVPKGERIEGLNVEAILWRLLGVPSHPSAFRSFNAVRFVTARGRIGCSPVWPAGGRA